MLLSYDDMNRVSFFDRVILVNNHEGYRGKCLKMEIKCGDKILELTKDHLILIKGMKGGLVKKTAQEVCIGDQMMLLGQNLNSLSINEDCTLKLPLSFKEVKAVRKTYSENSKMTELHTRSKKVIVSGILASCESATDNMFLTHYLEPIGARISAPLMSKVHNLVKIVMH